ncbi:MAG: putative O-succinylbenzoate--CoA ligase (OSB-CoA synthetase) (O-succinylbenzoyl-CoA synthetase) [Acidimicrobiales bacterium]|nr:putative O-succinylbenzoate--CoA ligase (OSB-CoA synthetase) (O-succinylbenzoyl-CoA synthetase) [Acidimicrobiales bacterium]
MSIAMLLEMAADGAPDRAAVGSLSGGLTMSELLARATEAGAWLRERGAERLIAVDVNSEAIPIYLFAAAFAGIPYVPLNYRLADDRLRAILARSAPGIAVVHESAVDRVAGTEGIEVVLASDFAQVTSGATTEDAIPADADDIAVLLFTSGTTGEPKAAVLRHRHLTSYIFDTVEFLGSDADEAALVSVPPYHIAAISAVLSSLFGGRRLVYVPQFSPKNWVELARQEAITHAMVVPTMLDRILDELESGENALPALRHLSYGGGRMPMAVVERAMTLLPQVNLVNAYGLTETASTIAVLTPDDHREAFASDDPTVRARLGSVGRPLPTIELTICDPEGTPVGPGEKGEICVRGEQVSGEYVGREQAPSDGWFHTNDGGWLDAAGYLFIDGRLDDVIVRGAENLSPGEIEDVLLTHPAVREAAVFGVADREWGEAVAAAVVLDEDETATEDELKAWVREQLRSSRTPDQITFCTELPYSETGKLLRRVLKSELEAKLSHSA